MIQSLAQMGAFRAVYTPRNGEGQHIIRVSLDSAGNLSKGEMLINVTTGRNELSVRTLTGLTYRIGDGIELLSRHFEITNVRESYIEVNPHMMGLYDTSQYRVFILDLVEIQG